MASDTLPNILNHSFINHTQPHHSDSSHLGREQYVDADRASAQRGPDSQTARDHHHLRRFGRHHRFTAFRVPKDGARKPLVGRLVHVTGDGRFGLSETVIRSNSFPTQYPGHVHSEHCRGWWRYGIRHRMKQHSQSLSSHMRRYRPWRRKTCRSRWTGESFRVPQSEYLQSNTELHREDYTDSLLI